ncbi:hypothetical protein Rs2_49306 [Raphanus sativus]|nr:hypothetical protein Rs2_49306 [Raphanus sativus]
MPSSFSKPTPPSSPNSSPLLSRNPSEADLRLREAEERLREAMAELQRRQRSAARGYRCDHDADVSCVANAGGNLCQSFLLSYGVRVGIGILLRAFKLARGHSYFLSLRSQATRLGTDLIVREEACRIGLLFGGFTVSVSLT